MKKQNALPGRFGLPMAAGLPALLAAAVQPTRQACRRKGSNYIA